jgi:hypothetical protein
MAAAAMVTRAAAPMTPTSHMRRGFTTPETRGASTDEGLDTLERWNARSRAD